MKLKLIAALGLALIGSGCVTTLAERRAFDEESCRGYGFQPGSEGFANCMLQIDLERSATRRAQFERDFAGPYGGPYVGFGYGYGFRRW